MFSNSVSKLDTNFRNTKHNKSHTKLYRKWQSMKNRCYRKNDPRYKNYGGRGIKICEAWLSDFMSFYNWAINNGYQENLSIDRINNDGNYEPSNCRWATNEEQHNNTTRNVYIVYNNKSQTMKQWSKELNINYSTIVERHRKGWTDEECLFGRSE